MAYLDSFYVSLLHMNGTDTSTTITDEGGHTWTANGNAQIDTAQSKFGGASALFDGTGDYITGDGGAGYAFGTGDFTVEFYVRLAAVSVQYTLFDCRPASTQGLYPTIYIASADNTLRYFTDSADRITGGALSVNTWYHIAVARLGTSTKMFLDGTQTGSTYTDSNNYLIGTGRPVLSGSGYTVTLQNLNGWMDELRVSKGVARWTSNFTVPTSEYGGYCSVISGMESFGPPV
jgi:hypothetical protein